MEKPKKLYFGESSDSRRLRGAENSAKSQDADSVNLSSYAGSINRLNTSNLSDAEKDATKYKIAYTATQDQFGTEQDLGDSTFRALVDEAYASMDPVTSAADVRGENIFTQAVRGAKDLLQTAENTVGTGVDWLWDNTVANIAGGIAGMAGLDGEAVNQMYADFMTPEIGAMAADVGLDILLGLVGGPAGIALAAGKNAVQQSENLYEGLTNRDDMTLEALDENQNWAKLGEAAFSVGTSLLPAIGAMNAGSKLTKAGTSAKATIEKALATNADDITKAAAKLDEAKKVLNITDDATQGILGITDDVAKQLADKSDDLFTDVALKNLSIDDIKNFDLETGKAFADLVNNNTDIVKLNPQQYNLINAITEQQGANAVKTITEGALSAADDAIKRGARLTHGGVSNPHLISKFKDATSNLVSDLKSGGLNKVLSNAKDASQLKRATTANTDEALLTLLGSKNGAAAIQDELTKLGFNVIDNVAAPTWRTKNLATKIASTFVPTRRGVVQGLKNAAVNIAQQPIVQSLADVAEYGDEGLNPVEMASLLYMPSSDYAQNLQKARNDASTSWDSITKNVAPSIVLGLLGNALYSPAGNKSGSNLTGTLTQGGALGDYYTHTPFTNDPYSVNTDDIISQTFDYLGVA